MIEPLDVFLLINKRLENEFCFVLESLVLHNRVDNVNRDINKMKNQQKQIETRAIEENERSGMTNSCSKKINTRTNNKSYQRN